MRILIIAQPRTGSTVFSKWLSKELGYYWLSEPFNSHIKIEIDKVFREKNVVCKLVYQENRGEWFYDKRIKNTEELLLLNWDYVFTLTRQDVYDQSISKVWGDLNHKWHSNYEITEDWINLNKKYIEKCYEELESEKKQINLIKSSQITYEGLFENKSDLFKICEIFNINELKYHNDISNKKRYRGGVIVTNNKLI